MLTSRHFLYHIQRVQLGVALGPAGESSFESVNQMPRPVRVIRDVFCLLPSMAVYQRQGADPLSFLPKQNA